MSQQKQLWVLTGADGAGKTTFYQQFLAPQHLPFVNLDILARQLDSDDTETAIYKATRLAEKLRSSLLINGVSFCFEMALTRPAEIDFVANARAFGYEVILIYIHLQNDELYQARIAQAHQSGGQGIPSDKIQKHIPQTMRYVKQMLPLVDSAKFYDNSSQRHPFQSIAYFRRSEIYLEKTPLPEWAMEILANYL